MKQTHLITAAALLALSPLVQAVDKHEPAFSRVIVDEFEARDADEGTVAAWEAAAWYGGSNAEPVAVSLEEGYVAPPPKEEVFEKVVEKELSPQEMKAKIEELQNRVNHLEAQLKLRDVKLRDLEGK